jgi:hypothetical protein
MKPKRCFTVFLVPERHIEIGGGPEHVQERPQCKALAPVLLEAEIDPAMFNACCKVKFAIRGARSDDFSPSGRHSWDRSFFVRPLAVSQLLTLKTRPKFVVGSRRKGQEINPQSGRWSIARRPIDRLPFRVSFKSVGRTAPSPQRVERAPDPRLDSVPLPHPIEVGHLIGLSSSRCGRPAAGQKGEARSLVVREAGSRVRSAVGWYCALLDNELK